MLLSLPLLCQLCQRESRTPYGDPSPLSRRKRGNLKQFSAFEAMRSSRRPIRQFYFSPSRRCDCLLPHVRWKATPTFSSSVLHFESHFVSGAKLIPPFSIRELVISASEQSASKRSSEETNSGRRRITKAKGEVWKRCDQSIHEKVSWAF